MNKRKAHKILSWLLLFFFAAGQIVVYAHQHHFKYSALSFDKHNDKHQTVQEKCTFCDQMHQAPIHWAHQPDYCYVESSAANVYFNLKLHFKGNSLIHADGLSPPALV